MTYDRHGTREPLKELLTVLGSVAARAAGEAIVAGTDSLLGDAEGATKKVATVIGDIRAAMRARRGGR